MSWHIIRYLRGPADISRLRINAPCAPKRGPEGCMAYPLRPGTWPVSQPGNLGRLTDNVNWRVPCTPAYSRHGVLSANCRPTSLHFSFLPTNLHLNSNLPVDKPSKQQTTILTSIFTSIEWLVATRSAHSRRNRGLACDQTAILLNQAIARTLSYTVYLQFTLTEDKQTTEHTDRSTILCRSRLD